jgi:hypothetical protein
LADVNAQSRSTARADVADPDSDRYHRKLQRILRNPGSGPQHLSGGIAPAEKRMSEQMKEATLSPRLINHAPALEDDGPLFQCTECDMIVRESDPYCPFCGAIFADSETVEEPPATATERPVVDRPARREEMIRPEKFDLFSLLRTRSRSKELLYQEALKGFAGSARLLEEIEHLISDVGSLGTDTSKARRLVSNAWEAARDGNWNLVSTLARQTEQLMSPSIPDLVRSEIARARKYLMEAKSVGIDISKYVLQIKSAMQALHEDDPDEALRVTKELMDRLREDSISWD